MFVKQHIAYEPGHLISRINMIKRGRHAFVDESFVLVFTRFLNGVDCYGVVTAYSYKSQYDNRINNTE